MVRNVISLLLVFLFSLTAGAAITPTNPPGMVVGGTGNGCALINDANPKGYTTLYGSSYTGTNQSIAFYKNGTRYQVPSGKYFHVVCFVVTPSTSAANTNWGLVYSTTSWSNGADYTAITGATYANNSNGPFSFITGSAYVTQTLNVTYDFPQNTYPGYFQPTNALLFVQAVGYEVTGTAP